MENKTVHIHGMKFQINQMPTRLALKLDKKVVTLLLPLFGAIDKITLESQFSDLDSTIKTFQDTLINMSDNEWDSFIVDMLSHVTYFKDGTNPVQINENVIDMAFRGKLLAIYELLFEVMKLNNFLPFELVAGGKLIQKIPGFKKQELEQKKTGNKSEKSENSKVN
jgi:hypothetical protein